MGQTKAQRRKEGKHTRVYRKQVDTSAWRSLSGSAVKVWIALAMFENGENNGEIFFSDRTGAAMCGLSRNTVRRSLQELEERGFIYCAERGGFSRKTPHAAKYGFTWLAGPSHSNRRAPRHDYEQWPADENQRAQFLTETGSISDMETETGPPSGSDFAPVETEKRLVSAKSTISGIEPQTVCQWEEATTGQPITRKQGNPDRAAFLASLRIALVDKLAEAEPGTQSDLAKAARIPGGTLSKFKSGGNLPDHHAAALARHLLRQAA